MVKYQKGEEKQSLVLRVQDTGGQPVFLSILELLTTADATVYLVVFSLPQVAHVIPRIARPPRLCRILRSTALGPWVDLRRRASQ